MSAAAAAVGAGTPLASDAAPLVRSIFFYNSHPSLGSTVGLHFFEPRYRLLVERALQEKRRACQFVFLPNYADYQAAHGDIGYLATIVAHRPVPSGNPNERPRFDVQIRFDSLVQVLFHWIEASSAALSECLCKVIGNRPSLQSVAHVPRAMFNQWYHTDWQSMLDDPLAGSPVRLFPAASHGHPNGHHWLLHASSDQDEARALSTIGAESAELVDYVYPIRVPRVLARGTHTTASSLLRQLGLLYIRHALVCGGGAAAAGSAAEADVATLSLKELRARLDALHVTEAEVSRCIEKSELVDLLVSKQRLDEMVAASSPAAERAAAALLGMPIDVACGCPAPLRIARCDFAHATHRAGLMWPRPGALWGSAHRFVVDEQTTATVGQMVSSVYDFEVRAMLPMPVQALASPSLYVPASANAASTASAKDEVASLLAYGCVLELSSQVPRLASITPCWDPAAALLPP